MTPEERFAIVDRAVGILIDTRGPYREKVQEVFYRLGLWDLLEGVEEGHGDHGPGLYCRLCSALRKVRGVR